MSPTRWTGPLAVLVLILTGHVIVAADPPKKDAGKPPRTEVLDALLQAYKLYELPFPPPDAPLVSRQREVVGKDWPTAIYYLGFLIKPQKAGGPDQFFDKLGRLNELDEGEVPKAVAREWEVPNNLEWGTGPALAIQLHARGWSGLAQQILDREARDERTLPETALAEAAWDYWVQEFRKPATDRKRVARLLKVISDRRTDHHASDDIRVLDAMNRSLVPGKGKPGTVEALVDDLIEIPDTDRSVFLFPRFKGLHPSYLNLARLGFDAVPTLIDHLDDDRLTRVYMETLNSKGYPFTVADVVYDLLWGLAGKDLGEGEVRRGSGEHLDKAIAVAWFAEAKKVGEEAYYARHVLGEAGTDCLTNSLMLDVLAHKHPKRLPEVYRRMLKERSEMNGDELGEAILASSLPQETKRNLFLEGTRCPGVWIRTDAIDRLRQVDRAKGLELLVAELDRVPNEPTGDDWHRLPGRLSSLVLNANDPAAWAALEKTAKRTGVKLRMRFLYDVSDRGRPPATLKAGVAFLSKFLDDATVRDDRYPGNDRDTPAGIRGFPKLEVRDLAAHEIAWLFGLKVGLKPEWTARDFAGLRERVRKALAEEGIR